MVQKQNTHRCESCDICEISLFKPLGYDSLCTLSDQKSESHFKKGQIIFNESNFPLGVYAVSTGSVKLYKRGKEGKEQIIRLAGPGDVLGYRAILCNENYGISAAVLEDSNLCFIPRSVFEDLLAEDLNFSRKIMKELSLELGESNEKVVGLVQKSVKERIAETLLNLKAFYGENMQTHFLQKQVSRTHIAQLCGATLESTVRVLKDLEQSGLITLHKKEIRINNSRELAQIAGIHF